MTTNTESLPEPVTWQKELRSAHPSSDPQYWPDSLMLKYCLREVNELRVAYAYAAKLCAARDAEIERLRAALNEINSWLVCACIATDADMAQSFPHMQQVCDAALKRSKS